ncbi:MAG: hypothetical protein WBZ33_08625 [Thermoactinomyces sp.]|jgi:hypothetical protein
MDPQTSIEDHLKQAFFHLTTAVNQSLEEVEKNESVKKRLGAMWEAFLSQFFSYVQEKGKEKRINLLGFISLPKLSKWFF